ncbi:MAG TPA: hypothetical protein VNR38_05045 [Ureibacillus sp.]|nr:hypothetical protein [Ureibacillus sp.]
MHNLIKQEMNKIEIPKELRERSKMGINQAKEEMKKKNTRFKVGAGVTAVLATACAFILFTNGTLSIPGNEAEISQNEYTSVEIPAIELPENGSNAKMIGLVVYNGKVYTQTMSEIDPEVAKAIRGEKLGTTKGNIDEWSKQDAYSVEFASTIGVADVYTVDGYDKDFRIMSFEEYNGYVYAQFFENLNGITIQSGKDIFGKLNMVGNISSAQYRTFDDWNSGINNFFPIENLEGLNRFIEALNHAKPLSRNDNVDPLGDSLNSEDYRELTLNLVDGTNVKLTLLKDGYIYYGYMYDAYFQMNEDEFSKLWTQLK